MFHEIRNVKQERGAGRRRWFEADGLELVVWLERGRTRHVTGFQLCYDRGQAAYALTWRPESGFVHSTVDTGDTTPLKNQTPVLTPDHDVPWTEVARRFDAHADSLDDWLRQLVHDKLAEHTGANAGR